MSGLSAIDSSAPAVVSDLTEKTRAVDWARSILNGSTAQPILQATADSPAARLVQAYTRSVATLLLLQEGELPERLEISELKRRVHLHAILGARGCAQAARDLELTSTGLLATWKRHLEALGFVAEEGASAALTFVPPHVREAAAHVARRAMFVWDNLGFVHSRALPKPSRAVDLAGAEVVARPARPPVTPATPDQLDRYRGWYSAGLMSASPGTGISERLVAALRVSVATLHLLEANDPLVQVAPKELTRRVLLATCLKLGHLAEAAKLLGYSSPISLSLALARVRKECGFEGKFRQILNVTLPDDLNADLDNLPEHSKSEWQAKLTAVRKAPVVAERVPRPRVPRAIPPPAASEPRERRAATEGELNLYGTWYSEIPCTQVLGAGLSEKLIAALKISVATLHLIEAKRALPELSRRELGDRVFLATTLAAEDLSEAASLLGAASAASLSLRLSKLKRRMGLTDSIRECRKVVFPEELQTALHNLPRHALREWRELLASAAVRRVVATPTEAVAPDFSDAELPVRRRHSWQVRAAEPKFEGRKAEFEDAVARSFKRLVDFNERRLEPSAYPQATMEEDLLLCAIAKAGTEAVYDHLEAADRELGERAEWRISRYGGGVFAANADLVTMAAEYVDYGKRRSWEFDRLPSVNLGWWRSRARQLAGGGQRTLGGIPIAEGVRS